MTPYDRAYKLISKKLAQYQRPVVWASGGKDSSALLHIMRPWAKLLTVLHGTKDDGWPGVTETLQENCEAWGYVKVMVVKPWLTLEQYVEEFGWPVEMVPTKYEGKTAVTDSCYRDKPIKFASWLHCTYVRGLYPLVNATEKLKADLVITGSRVSDAPSEMFRCEPEMPQGVSWARVNPVADWTTGQVYQYIDKHHITLPPLYEWKRKMGEKIEVTDCVRCTWQPLMWKEVIPRHYPELYEKYWPQIKEVYDVYRAEIASQENQLCQLSTTR